MRVMAATLLFLAATAALAQTPAAHVADDAKVIDRVAEASRKDLPQDLLKRIVTEDIELLRVKRADGTYQYAGYDKMEAGRISQSFSVDPEKKETILEMRGHPARRVVEHVMKRVAEFAKGAPQSDDITCVAVVRNEP